MSLLVDAFPWDESSPWVLLEPDDHSQELAGFESFRKTFHGGQAARSAGLRLLPTLAEGDLFAEGDDLLKLQDEAKLVLQNMERFTEEASGVSDGLQFRIQNILDAIERARTVSGGVVIW